MPRELPIGPDELEGFIHAAGENDIIDAKGPCEWDGAESSAAIAKDIVAFANSRDGGIIVIGKHEISPGRFEFTGLTAEQAASFETTKVATWINNRFSPRVRLTCHQKESNGKVYVIIAVSEFEDTPIICTKAYQPPTDSKKLLLRRGEIYMRNANAESAPLQGPEDVRALVGLAVTKRREEFARILSALVGGRSLLPTAEAADPYSEQLRRIRDSLADSEDGSARDSYWLLTFHPKEFREGRWTDSSEMRSYLDAHAVRIRSQFPPPSSRSHVREWGVCVERYDGAGFALAYSGLFLALIPYREDLSPYNNPLRACSGPPDPEIPPGSWIEFQLNLFLLIEFFLFASRFGEYLAPHDDLVVHTEATGLKGRVLVTLNPRLNLDPSEPCRASRFFLRRAYRAGVFQADWKSYCLQYLVKFFELFRRDEIPADTLAHWIDRFVSRDF